MNRRDVLALAGGATAVAATHIGSIGMASQQQSPSDIVLMSAMELCDLASNELFTAAAVLRDEAGVDQYLDVLLHRGEADRIETAEVADGALPHERFHDDVPPRRIAQRDAIEQLSHGWASLDLAVRAGGQPTRHGRRLHRRCARRQRDRS